jgi:aldose 1-epimerase
LRDQRGHRQHFFRPTPDEAGNVHAPFKTGCYPLVPFSNRIDRGRFCFEGRDILLPGHPQAAPHAMHGHGSVSAWTVTDLAEDRLRIEYRHEPGSWPFAYAAAQEVHLDPEQGLLVGIQVKNLGAETMPVGLGLHPFFDLEPGTRLTFTAAKHWLASSDFLPFAHEPVPAALDFSAGRELGGDARDESFDDWDGHALIRWAGRDLALEIQAEAVLGHLILHRPAGLPYFCLEPVSHVTNAFNLAAAGHADTGMRALAPGETLAAECRFTPIGRQE